MFCISICVKDYGSVSLRYLRNKESVYNTLTIKCVILSDGKRNVRPVEASDSFHDPHIMQTSLKETSVVLLHPCFLHAL